MTEVASFLTFWSASKPESGVPARTAMPHSYPFEMSSSYILTVAKMALASASSGSERQSLAAASRHS